MILLYHKLIILSSADYKMIGLVLRLTRSYVSPNYNGIVPYVDIIDTLLSRVWSYFTYSLQYPEVEGINDIA